jgi:hypothetical protein
LESIEKMRAEYRQRSELMHGTDSQLCVE